MLEKPCSENNFFGQNQSAWRYALGNASLFFGQIAIIPANKLVSRYAVTRISVFAYFRIMKFRNVIMGHRGSHTPDPGAERSEGSHRKLESLESHLCNKMVRWWTRTTPKGWVKSSLERTQISAIPAGKRSH